MIQPYDNLQEIFDKVWNSFVIDRKPAAVKFGHLTPFPFTALYKSDSTSCPIGLLIPDKMYDIYIEGKTIKYLLRTDKDIAHLFSKISPDVLFDLQKCHDYALEAVIFGRDFHKELEYRLRSFARWYDLYIQEE